MLTVLTIVVLLAATGATSFKEFSEQTLSSAGLIAPNAPQPEARLSHPEIPLRLKTPHSANENSISFGAQADGKNIHHGIHIKYTKSKGTHILYSHISSIDLTVVYGASGTDIRFDVIFGPANENKLALVVPIYQIPKAASQHGNAVVEDWARLGKVGTVSPISEQEFLKIKEKGQVQINLNWLDELLKYRVHDSVLNLLFTRVYRTRPIVLSEDTLNNIIHYFELFKKK